jgi:hypothetical protein
MDLDSPENGIELTLRSKDSASHGQCYRDLSENGNLIAAVARWRQRLPLPRDQSPRHYKATSPSVDDRSSAAPKLRAN